MIKQNKNKDVKFEVANRLRKDADKKSLESIKINNNWCKERPGTKKYNELSEKSRKAEEKSDKAYEKYYNYVHNNFTSDSIKKSMDKVSNDEKNKKKFFSFNFLKGLIRK